MIQQVAKVIYRKFFLKSALPIEEEVRRRVAENVKDPKCFQPPVTVFDEAHTEVGNLISNTTYPNFLKSDVYLQYIQVGEGLSRCLGDGIIFVSVRTKS